MATFKDFAQKSGVKPLSDDELDPVAGGKDIIFTPEENDSINAMWDRVNNAGTQEDRDKAERELYDSLRNMISNK